MAEEKKLTVFPVGITEKEIKKIADQAIEDSGVANEVPLATIADAGKVIKVGDDGKYELAEESGGGGTTIPSVSIAQTGGGTTLTAEEIATLHSSSISIINVADRQTFYKVGDYPSYMGNTMSFLCAEEGNLFVLVISKSSGELTLNQYNLTPQE